MMSFSLLLLLVTSLLLSYFDMRRIFSESLARRLQRGQTFFVYSLSVNFNPNQTFSLLPVFYVDEGMKLF